MFEKIQKKNRKGQQTAEYALLIALVVGAVIAMQTYVQRAFQAKTRDASLFMVNNTSNIGTTQQYEPYYLETSYNIDRNENMTETHGNDHGVTYDTNNVRDRVGSTESTYNAAGLINGI